MPGSAYRVRITGLRELQRKLRGDELLQAPYRAMLEEAARAAADAARAGAPRASGRLVDRIKHRVQAIPVPRYAVVKTTATRSSKRYRRYSYPRRLEFDPRSKHRDWLLKALQRSRGRVQSLLNGFGRRVQQRWRT